MCVHRDPEVYCMYKHTAYYTVYGGFIIELVQVHYVWLRYDKTDKVREKSGRKKKNRPRDADSRVWTI